MEFHSSLGLEARGDLRATGLISLENRRLTIHQRKELREMSEFDASYLHIIRPIGGSGER